MTVGISSVAGAGGAAVAVLLRGFGEVMFQPDVRGVAKPVLALAGLVGALVSTGVARARGRGRHGHSLLQQRAGRRRRASVSRPGTWTAPLGLDQFTFGFLIGSWF